MSLKATVIANIDKAFVAAGDLVGDITLRRRTVVFDPDTNETVVTTANYTGQGVFDFNEKKYVPAGSVVDNSTILWLKIDEEPKLSDVIIQPDLIERTIEEVNPVKTYDVVFIYQLKLAN